VRNCFAIALTACFAATAHASITLTIGGDSGDSSVQDGAAINLTDAMLPALRVGSGGDNERGHAAVFFFELPTLPSRDSLLAANLDLHYLGFTPFSFPQHVPRNDADLYGIGVRSVAEVNSADYYDGDPAGTSDSLITASLLTPASAVGLLPFGADSESNLLDFIRDSYNADGMPIDRFAVLRVNMAVDVGTDSGDLFGYELATADNSSDLVPQLSLTFDAVPEPTSVIVWVLILGGVYGMCLRSNGFERVPSIRPLGIHANLTAIGMVVFPVGTASHNSCGLIQSAPAAGSARRLACFNSSNGEWTFRTMRRYRRTRKRSLKSPRQL
jgi:hypothetical protein